MNNVTIYHSNILFYTIQQYFQKTIRTGWMANIGELRSQLEVCPQGDFQNSDI